MGQEALATEEEADEIAKRAAHDERHQAHIMVTRALSVGTATVWLKIRSYCTTKVVEARFCIEFANSEECTRFLHEDMRRLKLRHVSDEDTDVAVIGDILRALLPIHDDHRSEKNALRRGIPESQFIDEYPEPETQLISHRGHHRPCCLSLSISLVFGSIICVDWSATTIPPTFPSPSGAFQSLNNLRVIFPSHDRNSSPQDDLTITISAGEMSFSTGTNPISLANGLTLSSAHRTVNINYINAIMGDAFIGTINGGNNGGRNNTNTSSSYEAPKQLTLANGTISSSRSAAGPGSQTSSASASALSASVVSGSKTVNTWSRSLRQGTTTVEAIATSVSGALRSSASCNL
ncbi:hypothetical protein CCMSSC00406_0009850 [Pleurotus cornucopiae]|uniref:Uncharacterized protein n=1 Tax=Pleurotus cornucopiae TaxID=5321 RepID=A0ACB7J661_PLECO|nr:hypothetical protein CCMSSC00406_0009850 [Pleurotus cornucopiae]